MSFRRSVVRMFDVVVSTLVLGAVCTAQNFPAVPKPKPNAAPSEGAISAPVEVSPGNWSQLAKLTPDRPGEFFGGAAGISGDALVVFGGNPSEANGTFAFIFVKTAAGWANSPVAELRLPSPADAPISSLALDGDTIVVGIPASTGQQACAYVYSKPPGGWATMKPTATLTSNSVDGDFGFSVSVSGDVIVVGDRGYGSNAGSAYVFVKPAGGWTSMTQTAKLTASDGVLDDELGYSVSISGNTIALGAPQLESLANPGKAYVFVEPATGWTNMTQTGELTVPEAEDGSYIGLTISVNGDVIVAGAPSEFFPGAAYLFQKPSTGWTNMTETATLLPGDTLRGQYTGFGDPVSVGGKIVAVGAYERGIPPNQAAGGIYVFAEPAGGWQNAASTTVVVPSDKHYFAFFYGVASTTGNEMVGSIGVPYRATSAVYVFGLP
jgi:FG-GAP repeat